MTPNFHGRSETAEAVRSSEHLFRTLFCNYDKENKDKLPFVFPTYSSFYDQGSKILQEIFMPSFLIQILLFFIQDSRKKNMLSVIIFKVAHETFLFDFRHAAPPPPPLRILFQIQEKKHVFLYIIHNQD